MYHTIQFAAELTIDLEISPKHPLERLCVQKGTRLRAQLKPYVVETTDDLIEVADLFFEDGTTARRVSFACFEFIE